MLPTIMAAAGVPGQKTGSFSLDQVLESLQPSSSQ